MIRKVLILLFVLVSVCRAESDFNISIGQNDIDKISYYFNKSESKQYSAITISLENLIQESIRRNSTIIMQEIQADIDLNKIKYEEGVLDTIFSFSVSKSRSHIPNDAVDAGIQLSGEYEDDIELYNFGVGGVLSYGTKWDIAYTEQSKWSTYIESRYPNENTNQIDFAVRQPLLKGFGSENTLVKIDIAKLNSLISRSEYRKSAMDLVGTVIQLYWKLYGSYKLYLSWENSLEIAQEQLKIIEDGMKYGNNSKFELLSAQKSVSLRRVELYDTKAKIFEIQNKILNLLSLSSSYNDDILLIPVDEISIEKIEVPNLKDSYIKSIANWPELEILKEKLNISTLQVNYSKNQMLPQLDLALDINRRSLNINPKDSRKDLIRRKLTSWSSGLELSIPLYNEYAEQNYEMEKLKHLQSIVELNQLTRTLNNGLHSRIMDLQNNKISFYEYLKGINFQDELVSMEYNRLKLGKSSIVDVFEQQDSLMHHKRKFFNNIMDLKLSEASLEKATGVLLDRYNIKLYGQRKYKIAEDAQYGDK